MGGAERRLRSGGWLMGMFATSLRRQAEAKAQMPRPSGGLLGGMDFVDDVALDPSQVEFMPGWDDVQGTRALMGYVAGGGGGGGSMEGQTPGGGAGGSWLADLAGWAPPVQDVGDFAAMSPMQGLLGFLGMGGESMGLGVGASPVAPRASGGGGGFTARPPGRDFGGYDITPENMISRQGLTGVPQAVRTLLRAERALGVPGLSEAVTGEGYRSHEQQAALYQQHLAGQHPAPVAPPGQSYHEQGEAFDISSAWLDQNPRVRPWLERHGFTWDVPGEPWHAHYVGGGAPLRPATGNQNRPISTERRTGGPSRVNPLASYRRR